MTFTAQDAVKAFEELNVSRVHQMAVQSKLREWGATSSESATALQNAINLNLLVMDSLGSVGKP